MLKSWIRLQMWMRSEEGQALSEYGMVLALVLLGVIGAIGLFKDELVAVFNKITAAIKA